MSTTRKHHFVTNLPLHAKNPYKHRKLPNQNKYVVYNNITKRIFSKKTSKCAAMRQIQYLQSYRKKKFAYLYK